jgi:hypothetical protein
MKKIFLLIILTAPVLLFAQQPKLNLKLIGGINTNSYVYKVEGVSSDIFTGWQTGVGFRVIYRKAFAEFDGLYKNYGTSVVITEDEIPSADNTLELRMKALEFPMVAGYVPVKTPFLKWYLYGGFVNKFSLNGKIKFLGEEIKYKPKELDLHFYNLLARFGTQVDIAMFNFDINYNIGAVSYTHLTLPTTPYV